MTDLCYWFFIPLFARYLRIGLLVMGAAFLFGIHDADGLMEFYDNGHGPLAQLPLWVQAIIFLVGSDFMMYWIHRAVPPRRAVEISRGPSFLRGSRLDFGGAVSSRSTSSWAASLIDVVLLLAGISPNVMVLLGPFTVATPPSCTPT